MGPFLGALIGVLFYDTFLFTGSESLLNRPYVHFLLVTFAALT